MRRIAYVAHPLSGPDREVNRQRAAIWGCWIARTFNRNVSADWIWLTSVWDESERAVGLELDREMVMRADEIWLCGSFISAGMRFELEAYLSAPGHTMAGVVDLTGFGRVLPSDDLMDFVSIQDTLRILGPEYGSQAGHVFMGSTGPGVKLAGPSQNDPNSDR